MRVKITAMRTGSVVSTSGPPVSVLRADFLWLLDGNRDESLLRRLLSQDRSKLAELVSMEVEPDLGDDPNPEALAWVAYVLAAVHNAANEWPSQAADAPDSEVSVGSFRDREAYEIGDLFNSILLPNLPSSLQDVGEFFRSSSTAEDLAWYTRRDAISAEPLGQLGQELRDCGLSPLRILTGCNAVTSIALRTYDLYDLYRRRPTKAIRIVPSDSDGAADHNGAALLLLRSAVRLEIALSTHLNESLSERVLEWLLGVALTGPNPRRSLFQRFSAAGSPEEPEFVPIDTRYDLRQRFSPVVRAR